ncbi:FAD-dependent oxidoreductase, partial [Cronobacter sakazakii]
DLGGEIELNAKVTRLDTQGDKISGVTLADGRRIPARAVASNADVVHTYNNLLGHHPRGVSQSASLRRKRMSNSLFVLYFGLNHHHSQLAHHTVCFGPRYKGLIEDIFKRDSLADDFSLYLHAPCVTD